jgi:hypothetical protein
LEEIVDVSVSERVMVNLFSKEETRGRPLVLAVGLPFSKESIRKAKQTKRETKLL